MWKKGDVVQRIDDLAELVFLVEDQDGESIWVATPGDSPFAARASKYQLASVDDAEKLRRTARR